MGGKLIDPLTPREIDIIRRVYPTGGAFKCVPLLPRLDRKQIVRFAMKIGVRMDPEAKNRMNVRAWHEHLRPVVREENAEPRDPWPWFKTMVTARDWRIW